MLELAVSALLVGYLPGALLYRLPCCDRPRRAGLPAEERVFWAVLLSTAWSVVLVLALAGAGAYTFERLLWTNGLLAALLVVVGNRHLRYHEHAPRPGWTALIPVAVVAAGVWQLLPPAEYVMGGKDPGVYVNEGIQIAQRGTFRYDDPVVASVPEPYRDLFFPKDIPDGYRLQRFMGYFVLDLDAGRVIGQFPHGFPASIAIGYGLNGLSGARQTVVFWSLLGLVAVYLTAVRAFGRLVATAGLALLVVHVVEIWWGGYPNVEVASRALLFGSLLAFSHAAGGDRPFFGAVAGALAGLPLFFRYDAILTAGAALGAAILLAANRQRIGWAFWVSFALTSAAGLWYLLVPMWSYSAPYAQFTVTQGLPLLVAAAAAAIAFRVLLTSDRWAAVVRAAVPWSLAVAVVGLAAYAYVLREAGGRLAAHDAMAFRNFAWYVTPVGLLVAVAGLAVSLRRLFWSAPALFLTIVVHAVFFFYKTRIVPQHFWTSRRFLTVIVPAALLAIAALTTWVCDPRLWSRLLDRFRGRVQAPDARSRLRGALHAVLVAVALAPLGYAFWRAADPIRSHVEYAGLIPKLEALAAGIGDRDLLIVESRGTGSDLHVLALPLAYIYDRQVLVLRAMTPDKRALADFVRWAPARYGRVLFMGGSGTDLLSREIVARPIAADRFWVPEYDSPANAYPTEVRLKEFDYGLYELGIGAGGPTGPIDIAIGTLDGLQVRGFYGPERHEPTGVVFRWTRAAADVLLPGFQPSAVEVVVWMSHGGRPAGAPPPDTVVSLGGVVLGTAAPDDEVRPFRFALPAGLAEAMAAQDNPPALHLEMSTWSPQALLGVDDPRDLGVMVTRVQVR
jgi:hypothetical protein